MMTDVSRFTMIEKERNDLLKEIQINKEHMKLMKKSSKKLVNSSNNEINNQNDKLNIISNTEMNENSEIKRKSSKKNYNEQQLELLFLRASQSRSKKVKEYKNKLPSKQNKKKEIITKIKEQNIKIEELREKRNIKIDQLYTHYLKILKEGKDTRTEGLAWIIREIYNLGKEIIMSYLPDFIDEMGIRFYF